MRPSGGYLLVVVEDLEQTPEGRAIRDRHDTGPMATDREINCPSAGKSVSAYRETDMSASSARTPGHGCEPGVGGEVACGLEMFAGHLGDDPGSGPDADRRH